MTEEEQQWLEDMKRRIAIALRIPTKYLEPSLTKVTESLVRHKDSLWRRKK